MPTLTPKQPKKPKKSHKLAWILASPFLLVIGIWALFSFVINPIWDHFDKQKFTTLDTEMRALFEEIKAVGGEEWKYLNACDTNYSGPWPTGDYTCLTSMSLIKKSLKSQDILDTHNRYYPIFENKLYVKELSGLEISNSDYFGKKFVVNGAEKKYIDIRSEVKCSYFIKLEQPDDVHNFNSNSYGSSIEGKEGDLIVSFRCEDNHARSKWYSTTADASYLIPYVY